MNDWNVWILKTKYRIHGRYVGLESPKPRSYSKATLGPLLHSVHRITWRKLEERKRGRELASSCVCPISVSNSQWWHLTLSRNSWSSSGSGWQFHSQNHLPCIPQIRQYQMASAPHQSCWSSLHIPKVPQWPHLRGLTPSSSSLL